MLATLGDPSWIGDRTDWALEIKWDGYRLLARFDAAGIRLFSRRGNDVTATYPDLVAPLRSSVRSDDAVLDGEVIGLDRRGRPSFESLQTRAGLTDPVEVERARASVPVRLMVFDLLRLEGRDLRPCEYDERRRELDRILVPNEHVQLSEELDGDLAQLVSWSKQQGYEGLMAKRRASTYQSGTRSRDWVKLKNRATKEVIVAGWLEGRRSLTGTVGSLILAVPDPVAGLRFVGGVGTGFTRRERDELLARFAPLATDDAPLHGVPANLLRRAHWLRPELLGEVTFEETTTEGLLRQPSWRGLRADKTAADIDVDN